MISFDAVCLRGEELQADGGDTVPRASVIVCADQIQQNCANKMHHIHKEKYDLLWQAMNNSKQFCSLIFDKNGTLLQAEPDISNEGRN
jgi:hypothetical protein